MTLPLRMTAVAILLCVSTTIFAEMQPQDAAQVFQEANVAFSQANKTRGVEAEQLYDKAILGYKRLAEEGGISNAKLYTNLANTYLLRNDIGNSVLWYRRALQLEPANPEIAKNLAFARSKRLDKVDAPVQKRVLQTLLFWHYDLSLHTRFIIACASLGLLCCILSLTVLIGRRPYLTAGSVFAAILLVAMASSLVAEELTRTAGGVITASEIIARQGDGQNYPEAFKEPLHAGTEFTVLERRPGWVRFELADSSRGWLPSQSVELF